MHCREEWGPEQFSVLVGSNILNATSDLYEVDLIRSHPDFNANTIKNDVAVIRVNKKIIFGNNVKSIKLGDEDVLGDNIYYLSGWGLTEVNILSMKRTVFTNNLWDFILCFSILASFFQICCNTPL